jgi:glucose-1-phosphate cytidylyltransferase
VILAGGLGTRLAEETEIRPKPMVEIGGRPILWHVMKQYAHYGFREFVLALGYKGEDIKHYFLDYHSLSNDMAIDLATGQVTVGPRQQDDWLVHLVDTGQKTNTGGRVKRLESLLSQGTFMVTYGDGVSNVDLQALLSFHRSHGRLATVTAVRPPARFGSLVFDGDRVKEFAEKPQTGEGWINGGFLVLEPGVFSYLDGDASSLEAHAMERLAADGELMAYRHDGFWQCMDTKRDLDLLRRLWDGGAPPWVATP